MATLVMHYKLENDYTDSVNGNTVVAQGSGNAFSTTRRQGSYSLSTNGSGGALKTGGLTGVTSGNADRSMGFWIYYSGSVPTFSFVPLMVGDTSANYEAYYFRFTASTTIEIDHHFEGKSFTIPAWVANTWYHVWHEYTAATKTGRIYVNNVESSSGGQVYTNNSALDPQKLALSQDESGGNRKAMILDDVRFYNGVTSATERDGIFRTFKPRVVWL